MYNPISSSSKHLQSTLFRFKFMTKITKMSSSSWVSVVSKCTVFPSEESTLGDLKLSVSDLNMLPRQYIQRGCLVTTPPFPITELIYLLRGSLSNTLTQFPPLAGRLVTDSAGFIYITCNDAGVEFIHANAPDVYIRDILGPTDIPEQVKEFFAFNGAINYEGHTKPIAAVQVTDLADGVFISCCVNHAVADGTSFWNFFNTFADASRGIKRISLTPDFSRESVLISSVVPKIPAGGPRVTSSLDAPLRQMIFSFSKESISKLKAEANNRKQDLDIESKADAISSYQALCALAWRGFTRARNLPSSKTTMVRMAVNCRHRLEPKLEPLYFGNATQWVMTYAAAGDVLTHDLRWCSEQLSINLKAHNNLTVRKRVSEWEHDPQFLLLQDPNCPHLVMADSPNFPMYDNDFGWGKPIAIRTGPSNKFDGKASPFQGRQGNQSVDLEVVLPPEVMRRLESDPEFMQYVSDI